MSNRTKIIALGIFLFLLGGVLGAWLGVSLLSRVFVRDLETNMSEDLQNSFLRVANSDGSPKPSEAIVRSARHVLAMETVNTGKMYPSFRDKGIRDAIVMYFKRIDANRAGLQPDNSGEWEAEADRVRACVVKFATDNKQATECLNSCSRIDYEIGDARTGKITRSVACKP